MKHLYNGMILQVLNHFSNDAATSCGQNPVDQMRRIKLCEYQIFAISIDLGGFCPSRVFHKKTSTKPQHHLEKRTFKKKSTRKKNMSVISPPISFCRGFFNFGLFGWGSPPHPHFVPLCCKRFGNESLEVLHVKDLDSPSCCRAPGVATGKKITHSPRCVEVSSWNPHCLQGFCLNIPASWWFQPIRLKNMQKSNRIISPGFRGEN